METVNLFLDRPVALLVVLMTGALLGAAVEQGVARADAAKRKAYWRGRKAGRGQRSAAVTPIRTEREPEVARADFAAEQLKIVSRAAFTSRPLLNHLEAKVFEAAVLE